MTFSPLPNKVALSDGEVVVRSYHCTHMHPLFALIGVRADGYIVVTNRRVLYYAEGRSFHGATGSSKVCSEIPIADVSSIETGSGTRFSMLRVLLSGVATIPALLVIGGIGLLGAQLAAIAGTNSYLPRFLAFIVSGLTAALFYRAMSHRRSSDLRYLFSASATTLWGSLPDIIEKCGDLPPDSVAVRVFGAVMAATLGAFQLWNFYWFVRRDFVSIGITSKSGFARPIEVRAYSFLSRGNRMASLAARMAPGADAEPLFREIGAVVADIQALGDHGVEKWRIDVSDRGVSESDIDVVERPRAWIRASALAVIALAGALLWIDNAQNGRNSAKMRSREMAGQVIRHAVALRRDERPEEIEIGTKLDVAQLRVGVLREPRALCNLAWRSDAASNVIEAARASAESGLMAYDSRKYTDALALWSDSVAQYSNIMQRIQREQLERPRAAF